MFLFGLKVPPKREECIALVSIFTTFGELIKVKEFVMNANDSVAGRKSARSRVGPCIMCIHQGSLKATYITVLRHLKRSITGDI